MAEDLDNPGNNPGANPPSDAPNNPPPSDPGGNPPSDPPPSDPPAQFWNDNWRDKIAEDVAPGDEKFRQRLDRFSTPADVTKSWLASEKKISSGEFMRVLPENATEDEIKAYRENVGIPDDPKGYLEGIDGFDDSDKGFLDSLTKSAHESNIPPQHVQSMLNWYKDWSKESEGLIAENLKQVAQNTEDALRSEYGADYRGNMNAVNSLLQNAPEGVAGQLLNATLEDGTPLKYNADAMKFLVSTALELNPQATVLPGGVGNDAESISAEISKIQSKMATQEYRQNVGGIKDRYMKLLSIAEKQGIDVS